MHINEAVLHEYLDRGAEGGAMSDVDTHLNECATCRLLLDSVIKERSAASAILRAAAPTGMARPSFESLLPRPKFDTLEGAHATDVVFDQQIQYKQTTLGMRGQAFAWAWAATLVVAVGAGWFASEFYQQEQTAHSARVAQVADSTAKARVNNSADSTAAASAAADSVQRLTTVPEIKKPESASRVASTTNATSNTDQASNAMTSAPSTMAEMPSAPAALQGPSKTDTRTTDNMPTRSVMGGKAAADKPIRSAELVGSVNLDSYPDTLTVSVIGMPKDEWREISADSALALLGGQMIRARGLPVLDYAVSSNGAMPRIRVRQSISVRQNSARKDTIEIYQTPPRGLDHPAAPEQLTSRAGRAAMQNGPLKHRMGGSYFRRFYATMLSPDNRVVTVIAGKAELVNKWRPELTSLPHD